MTGKEKTTRDVPCAVTYYPISCGPAVCADPQHDPVVTADIEVVLDDGVKVYLCLDHAKSMIRASSTGDAETEVNELVSALEEERNRVTPT